MSVGGQGISRPDIQAMADLYGEAHLEAVRSLKVKLRASPAVLAASLDALRENMRQAVVDELRERGCPEAVIDAVASGVIVHGVRKQASIQLCRDRVQRRPRRV
jgi:hypothetical protein